MRGGEARAIEMLAVGRPVPALGTIVAGPHVLASMHWRRSKHKGHRDDHDGPEKQFSYVVGHDFGSIALSVAVRPETAFANSSKVSSILSSRLFVAVWASFSASRKSSCC